MSEEQQLQWLKDDFVRLESKVDSLLKFKWQIMGGTALLSFVVGIIIQLVLVKVAK